MVTPAPGHGRLRASHADREQVVDVLKAAFVQGRLTQDELDVRIGQALAARTYADLAALTADLPAEPDRAPVPSPEPAPVSRNRAAHNAIKTGATVIGGGTLLVSGVALALGQPVAAVAIAIFMMVLTAASTAFVAALIALVLKAESLHNNRSRGQLPPRPQSGQTRHVPRAHPSRRHQRRPNGSLAIGRAS